MIDKYSAVSLFSLLIFAWPLYACTEFLGNGCLLFSSKKHQYTKALYMVIILFLSAVFVLRQGTKMTAAVVYAYLMYELLLAIYVIYTVSKFKNV